MRKVRLGVPFWVGTIACFWIIACGGGGGASSNNTNPPSKSTPTVTVTPGSSTIPATQSLSVTVTVSGSSGTPTGSVTLSSGSYTSSAVTLSSGTATINIPAGSLAAGADTLTASYTPDTAGASNYYSATGTGSVTVTTAIPAVAVTPASFRITTIQNLSVTVAVSGGSGAPTATGSVTLSSGSYTSSAIALSNGSVSILVPAGSLAIGSNTLTASYTPDSASSSIYKPSSGSAASITVTPATPTVAVTPASSSITAAQSLNVSISVSGGSGAPTPTGSVTLSSGSYTSSAVTLSSGSASITIPAGSLGAGNDTLTATYTPDTAGAAIYASSSGTGSVTVTQSVPTVTVTPQSSTIAASESLPVSITVSGGAGAPVATGSVTLSSGSYTSGAVTLSGGSASITIPANTLATGTDTLTAAYTPDSNSSSVYTSAQGTASVTVEPPAVITSFSASPTSIVAGSSSGAQLTANFSGGTGVINPGNIAVTSGTPVTVNPTATTTYTLTVTPPAGSAVTQTITLTVYPSVSVCTSPSCSGPQISGDLLGMNLAMWYDNITNAGSILSAFSTAGITAVRWPGGSNSDLYHWANNSGCNGMYAVPTNTFTNFEKDIVQAGNLDLAVTANYGSNTSCNGPGDPTEAADWAAAAVTDGTPIHYMTIGNESYGSWEVDMHATADQHNPTVYACEMTGCTNLPSNLSTGLPSGTPGFYSAIKTAVQGAGGTADTTLVGVQVNADSTCCATNANNWDSTVLSQAKGSYDFVEFHYYPQNPPNESDTFLVQNAAQGFTNDINTIKSELQAVNEPNTPIYVGEVGSVSSNPGKQSWSITQGLYAGQLLGEAMNDGVARLTWWIGFGNCNGNQGNFSTSLYGWQNFGAYNVFADGAGDTAYPNGSPCNYGGPIGTMSPTAEAFNLFQQVAVKGEYPQTTTVVDGTGYTRAYAATHSGGAYALVLFNLNQTAAETVSVAVEGQTISNGGITVTTYDKEMYDQSDPTCATDAGCSYDSGLVYPTWAQPTPNTIPGPLTLPLTLTLQPWSMNVVIVKP